MIYKYQYRAQLNRETRVVMKAFATKSLTRCDCLVMQNQKDTDQNALSDNLGIVYEIKRFVKKQNDFINRAIVTSTMKQDIIVKEVFQQKK